MIVMMVVMAMMIVEVVVTFVGLATMMMSGIEIVVFK